MNRNRLQVNYHGLQYYCLDCFAKIRVEMIMMTEDQVMGPVLIL